nr:MAG TPA: Extended Signal Peptide of Type V secretion system [Caudoviricetes sp.]
MVPPCAPCGALIGTTGTTGTTLLLKTPYIYKSIWGKVRKRWFQVGAVVPR